MAAKGLVCGGVRRRIGKGTSTLIWEHPWLQDELDPMIHIEMPPQMAGAKVVGLIDPDTGTWDHHILTDIFQPDDVPRILRIPVSPDYDYMWYWYGDPKGCYSVKDGYRRIVGNYTITNDGAFDKWLTLWKLKIPPKWKTFLWRAISNILLTIDNFLIKRVDVDPSCAMCGVMQEDIMHSLVLCGYASSIWTQSNHPLPNIVTNVFHEWFSAILNVLDTNGIVYAAAILYHIWRARNGAVWDAYLLLPRKVVTAATATMHAWQRVHGTVTDRDAAGSSATAEQPPTPLPVPAVTASVLAAIIQPRRCFVDARYYHDGNSAVMGVVLLDADGRYVTAYSALLPNCFSPLMTEAFACKEALSWLRGRGEQDVQIYTDCPTL
ncbi:PREDICTED: uncharacterized protein LOC109162407 [Ipomoea nil]|uniref:uncharacterized protein LOC109162407 n=1 Tax=Ipomoea nil TaxID=35883 RepID=UPI000901BEBA|nr:PREDICTED: uncharacterized protein LOC109162407 [Ipomoea nil]